MFTTLLTFYIIYRLMRPSKNDFIAFVKKWEGGKSRATTDSASNYGGPGGVHTNKGITWATYKGSAKLCGYTPTAEDFLNMSDKRWLQIFDKIYWDKWQGDKLMVRDPFLAFFVVQFAWGSGNKGAEIQLAKFQRKYMGIIDNDITPTEIVKNFIVTPIPIPVLAKQLINFKANYFKSLNQPANIKGWLNRLNDFEKKFAPYKLA